MEIFSKQHVAKYKNALSKACDVLLAHGFKKLSECEYEGVLSNKGVGVEVIAKIPKFFPYSIPQISIKPGQDIGRRAHIESNGKLCLAHENGILVDSNRPAQIVEESLVRANDIIFGREDSLEGEFLAYWKQETCRDTVLLYESVERSSPLTMYIVDESRKIITDSPEKFEKWIKANDCKATQSGQAFLLSLSKLPELPRYDDVLRVKNILDIADKCSDCKSCSEIKHWLTEVEFPATVIFAYRDNTSAHLVLFSARIEHLERKVRKSVENGFRRGRLPKQIKISRVSNTKCKRANPACASKENMLKRAGGNVSLCEKSVGLIGCGSLGSHIAELLAGSGVGTLKLIDGEALSEDNIYRHVLGFKDCHTLKARSMSDFLLSQYPHISVECHAGQIQELLDTEGHCLNEIDLLVIAVGDETLELQLNGYFGLRVPRIHAWLEPYGIGGHVLRVGSKGSPACYRCLFGYDDDHYLYNKSSLVKPGQDFLKSMSGCSGVYTPYGKLHAVRGAVESTQIVLDTLAGDDSPLLVSWYGDITELKSQGYELSKRGERISMSGKIVDKKYRSYECQDCNNEKPSF